MEALNIVINGFTISIHQSIIIWLAIGVFVCLFLIIAGNKFKNADPSVAPKGFILIFEIIVKTITGVIGGNLKKKTWMYLPFFGTTMLMMLFSNLAGLLGLQSPTSNLSVNATLSLMVFFLIHYTDIKLHGIKNKFKAWCEPIAILLPLNIIGDLALPLSLSLRLFGNMLGGTIIVTLIYMVITNFWPFSIISFAITPFLHIYFDVFSAFMQTYIYFMLASFFLSEASDVN